MSGEELKLLPCPFCGGEAESDHMRPFRIYSSGKPSEMASVYCRECNAEMAGCYEDCESSRDREELMSDMIAAWNRRHPLPEQPQEGESLSSTAALEAEVERWHDAYCIAHDQAMSNGEAYQDAAAQIASLKQRLESAEHAMEMALKCTPFIRSTQSQFHGVGRLHEIAYECGDPWEILRAFLQEQEKLPDSVAFLATIELTCLCGTVNRRQTPYDMSKPDSCDHCDCANFGQQSTVSVAP